MGRADGRRVHGSILHIDIRDGKVWIEHNGTDARIGKELFAAASPGATSYSVFSRRSCGR